MKAPLSWLKDYVDIDIPVNELEKKLDAEKARHRAAILELENVIVDLMVENYRYESRVKALERLLEEYEKNQPITDTREEADDGE